MIKIGDQHWLAENLKVTRYRNGDTIFYITDAGAWDGLTAGAFCCYLNDEGNIDTYGFLYNWYAVDDSRNIAPEGCHVATDDDWQTLVDYLGGEEIAGGKLKEMGMAHWDSPNTGATNESGFTALPGGYRFSSGTYNGLGSSGNFWTSTMVNSYSAWSRGMSCGNTEVGRGNTQFGYGLSVRCIADTFTIDTDCADVDNNGSTNILDITYLISFLYKDGPGPLCGETATMTDIDGYVYQTVKIGDQWWMMENLKVTHYRNGDPIPHVTDGSTWSGLSTGAYCEYDNNPANPATYGRLYNWYAVDDSRNIAPEGWHVPTDEDWQQLEMYLGMSSSEVEGIGLRGTDEGGKLKEAGTVHWNLPNEGATNESGFMALPGGYRDYSAVYFKMGDDGEFWSSTGWSSVTAFNRILRYDEQLIGRINIDKKSGYSVRCIRD